ncbi:MAG: ribosomal protein S12 methylthiotransferase [Bacteroidetes bacterium]|nr:MAG: ribosomal protein S12 methylthiotransferase [Bacteroidota bacterium]
MSKIVNIVTLGCSKNKVDSEFLGAKLFELGYKVEHDSDHNSDIVIVNTCGFIGDAKEESVETILSFAQLRKRKKLSKLVVMGCLSQRYKKDLEDEIHEVDAFFGVNDLDKITSLFESEAVPGEGVLCNSTRILSTLNHYAYLKISEGCDRSCSFCAIPLIRGKHVSQTIESLVKEAGMLAAMGVKELVLIAQELTYYGLDVYGKRTISQLIEKLSEIEGIEWIRIQYAYPHGFPDDLLDVMASNPKVCNYIDLPLQHISSRILASMKRNVDKQQTLDLVKKIRERIPGVAFRTTFIVGYPGETEEEFKELFDFVKEARFDRMGVFAYSPEEGTSAFELEDTIDDDVKVQRVELLMELQQGISLEINLNRIGSVEKVLIDKLEGDYFIGRTAYDSPEVDNEVLILAQQKLQIGSFYQVEIIDADHFDLYGKVIQS